MRRIMNNIDLSCISVLSKSMYSLVNYWSELIEAFRKKWPSETSVFRDEFWISICGFLSIGATFSSKLSQMLFEVIHHVEPPQHLTNTSGQPFLILLEYLLEIDDRVQVSRLTSGLTRKHYHSEFSSSIKMEQSEDDLLDFKIHYALFKQVALRSSESEDLEVLAPKFLETFKTKLHSAPSSKRGLLRSHNGGNRC